MTSLARKLRAISLIVVTLLVMPRAAAADTDLGQFCWTLATFNDVFRCSLNLQNGSALLVATHCTQQSAGSYQVAGAGVLTVSFPTPGSLQMSFVGSHDAGSSFGGNKTCSVIANLSPSTLGGPVTGQCSGTTTPFSWTSTMVFAACPTAAAEAAASTKPAAGDPQQ